jgi:hypothetical protein
MTGGVDLTGTSDLFDSNADESLEYIRQNKHPEMIETLTGGHGPLYGSVHLEVNADNSDHESEQINHGLHKVLDRFSGAPVRVRPASRMRTERLFVAPGSAFLIGQRDYRRTRLTVIVTSVTATDVVYVGADQTTALTMGFVLPVNQQLVMLHADLVGIATPASNNVLGLTLSIMTEIQE